MSRYLLDANIFIQAKNLHYGFDFCPAFWNWLERMNQAQKVASIEKVKNELLAIDDELSDWVRIQENAFFLSPDDGIVPSLSEVSQWANQQNFDQSAVSEFLNAADYWLVAHAKAHGGIIVTHEIPSEGVRKIKIPNACIGLNIECITPYEMLRKENARFVLV